MSKDDQESNNELVETNRNLSAAMERIEMRCKLLEEKNEKLKRSWVRNANISFATIFR